VSDRGSSPRSRPHLSLGGLDDADPGVAALGVAPGMTVVLGGIANCPTEALSQLGGEVLGLEVLRGDTFPEHDGALAIGGGHVGHHKDLWHERLPWSLARRRLTRAACPQVNIAC
jgi:hypothetical protein